MGDSEFKVPEKRKNDAQQAFNLFAKGGDLQTKQLGNLFKSLGLHMDSDRTQQWADEEDEDATGVLIWEQFFRIFERKLREDEDERELRNAFRVLDKNNRGVIDVEDLRWILESLGDDLTKEDIEQMIQETDTDQSGTVDYEEFCKLMMC